MDDVLGYAGKRAVVTGAASGMGAATVDLLVAAGWQVVAVDRSADDPDLDFAEVEALARQHLAGYKIPRRFERRDELARTATGKLQKRTLRENYTDYRLPA